ncbi:cobalamin biosynthesis protein [Tunturiibacter lichenicola]|uniref:cobalamin biosynthesis protein n=1 Tax=Tunturiibacter lichenicola TaxID=2051959 RepID=UPI0021B451F6|nr:cobalamin biosynthesis protein [Edaphobacter lichenicola]
MSQLVAIGIGCSSRATPEDVVSLIESCAIEIVPGSIMATLDRCASTGEAVAARLGLRLMLFPADTLSKIDGVKNHSDLASARVGTSSVAEASALASLGPAAQLTLPRKTGRFCTCAVAVLP